MCTDNFYVLSVHFNCSVGKHLEHTVTAVEKNLRFSIDGNLSIVGLDQNIVKDVGLLSRVIPFDNFPVDVMCVGIFLNIELKRAF